MGLLHLKSLPAEEVPLVLKPEFYFDFASHPFEHEDLLEGTHVIEVLAKIHGYAEQWIQRAWAQVSAAGAFPSSTKLVGDAPALSLPSEVTSFAPDVVVGTSPSSSTNTQARKLFVGKGACILGGTLDLRGGDIWLSDEVVMEPGAHVAGPCIIGHGTVLRAGAYVRGDVVVGRKVVLRGELKNAVVMDLAELCHPGYVGDSIIGYKGHFGCQALTANLGLFGSDLSVPLPGGSRLALGRKKMGLILGDGSQLGCNAVSDPGTFLAPQTHVYPLTRLSAGFYGPREIIWSKGSASEGLLRKPFRPPTL